jgi:hypothetical protein
MSDPSSSGFDRIRPRGPAPGRTARARAAVMGASTRDPQGKRALFTSDVQQATFGTATVECSSCEQTTTVTARQLARLSLPSVHLPVVKRSHPSWLRCPACGRRTWVKLRIQL